MTLGFPAWNAASQLLTRTVSNDNYAFTPVASINQPYTANGLNQYASVAGAAFAYDPNGNLTSDGSTTYGYDVENRLTSGSGAKVASLVYDPLGRLFETSGAAGANLTRFLYDGDELVAEYNSAGTMLRRFVHGSGVDDPIVWYEGSGFTTRRHLLANEQGSPIAVTDQNGNLVQANAWDEYGVPKAGNLGRFGYTGQIWIPELALWHYKARAYSPGLGRFMQTDPVGYEDQVNLYTYVQNEPISASDPTGTYICSEGAEKVCDLLDQGLGNLRHALAEASKSEAEMINRILDAYGERGQPNDVMVSTGNTGKGATTETKNKVTIVTFDNAWLTNFSGMRLAYRTWTSTVAHEGQHIYDERVTFHMADTQEMTTGQRLLLEYKAYLVSGTVLGLQRVKPLGYQPLWEPGITLNVQRQRAKSAAWSSVCRAGRTCK